MKKLILTTLLAWFVLFSSTAQQPQPLSATELHHKVEKLNFLGSVLYIAAHPDDENTRLISHMANATKARTAYLSLTRGDGGQNLIGSELRELLGVLRTQELLAARSVDGGEQFFTRANDFGYSKHPDETLEIWNKEAVLGDVVKRIRTFKPDIIINRFDHRSPGTTHGHHTSSAILSVEAFDLVGNPSSYPDQVSTTGVWQPQRLFFNTSWWFYGSEEKFKAADKGQFYGFDIGNYYPERGMSNNEIASIASSQHLSQGFGRTSSRGGQMEYLELLRGDMPDEDNIFSGIDTSWNRVKGGKPIGEIFDKILANFNYQDPAAHMPDLLKAYQLIENLEDGHWKTIKKADLEEVILGCAGILAEVLTESPNSVSGDILGSEFQIIDRAGVATKVAGLTQYPAGEYLQIDQQLKPNETFTIDLKQRIPENTPSSSPYWLKKEYSLGMYQAPDSLIGRPESPPAAWVEIDMEIMGVPLKLKRAAVYKTAEPDKGELYEPFVIIPKATTSIPENVYIFNEKRRKSIPVTVTAHTANLIGELTLNLPDGWSSSPEKVEVSIAEKDQTTTYYFDITPPDEESTGELQPVLNVNGQTCTRSMKLIQYPHIPTQTVLLPSKTKLVRMNIQKAGQNIGYIMGAGDQIPESLKQIGYVVIPVRPQEISPVNLKGFDAVVMGIRAYNVLSEELKNKQPLLLQYVKEGGNLLIQYNTAGRNGFHMPNLAPYPLKISRDRVTDENSPVDFVDPSHPALNYPNRITKNDFEGWVQERGLYFPNNWAPEFTPILSMADPGEEQTEGSLLVAEYGQGFYIYTGLSFFRELPAGVPGAYKLFANLLSLGKSTEETTNHTKGKP